MSERTIKSFAVRLPDRCLATWHGDPNERSEPSACMAGAQRGYYCCQHLGFEQATSSCALACDDLPQNDAEGVDVALYGDSQTMSQ